MIPLLVVLPFFFAFTIILLSIFDIYKNLLRTLFFLGIFSPWLVFSFYVGHGPADIIVGGWEQISGIQVTLDGYNQYFILGELILFSGVSLYSLSYFDFKKENPSIDPTKSVYPLILIFHGSILGSFVSRDLFNFFVYMEITSLCSIILVAISSKKGAKIASFRYLMMYFLSSFFFVFSIGLIYVKTGYLNFELIEEAISGGVGTEIKIAMTMAILALITKAGIFPLYFLLPEAYSKSDSPVTALLSGMGGKVQIFGMVLLMIFLPLHLISTPLKILAFSSMIFGISIALFQNNIKKVFAYSSISQMGYILLGITLIEDQIAIYHSFIHALSIGGLFLCAGILMSSQKTKYLDKLTYRKNPILMGITILLSLSIIGIPPFLMSHNKQLITGALDGYWMYIFYMVSVGTAMVFTRLNYNLWKSGGKTGSLAKINILKIIPPFIFALTMFGVGFYINVELVLSDFIILSLGITFFLLLERLKVFEMNIPEPFTEDVFGLAKEINYYTGIFLLVNITFLIQFFY